MNLERLRMLKDLVFRKRKHNPSILEQASEIAIMADRHPLRGNGPLTSLPEVDKSKVDGLMSGGSLGEFTWIYMRWQLGEHEDPDDQIDFFSEAQRRFGNSRIETLQLSQWMNANPNKVAKYLQDYWHQSKYVTPEYIEPFLVKARAKGLKPLKFTE